LDDLLREQLPLIGFFLTCLIISNIAAAKIAAFKLRGINFQFIVPADDLQCLGMTYLGAGLAGDNL